MKFKSGIIADGRGSIGGLTLSKNSFGGFIRARSKPCRSVSESSSDSRDIIGSLQGLWRALTPTQKAGWKAAAEFLDNRGIHDERRFGTGLNYFIAYNSLLWKQRDTSLLRRAPPDWPPLTAPPTLSLVTAVVNNEGFASWDFQIYQIDARAAAFQGDFWMFSTSFVLPRGTTIQPPRWSNTSFQTIPESTCQPQNTSVNSIVDHGQRGENASALKAQAIWSTGWFSPSTITILDVNPLPP